MNNFHHRHCSVKRFARFELTKSRWVVVNHEAKEKQHAHAYSGLHDHYSGLFIWMAVLNIYNAVAQPFYSYYLVYYRPSTCYWVEPTAKVSTESAYPFLRTSQSTTLWVLVLISMTIANTQLTHALICT